MKVLGTTQDITTCECCGKKNLRKTVALDRDGAVVYFGSDCAAAALLGKKSAKNANSVWRLAQAVEYAKKNTTKKIEEINAYLNLYSLANADIRRGQIIVWNSAGEVAL